MMVYVHEKFGRVPTTPLRDPWCSLGPIWVDPAASSGNASLIAHISSF